MLALGAGLKILQTMLYAVINALVIAGLEVQGVVVCVASPVASVQRSGALEEHGRADGMRIFLGEHNQDAVRDLRADPAEKRFVEVGHRAANQECATDEGVNTGPCFAIDCRALQATEAYAVFLHAPSITFCLFSLSGTEGRQDGIEVFVIIIVPVKLTVLAQ